MKQRDNAWWTSQLEDLLPSASEWVAVPARHGSWVRNFVPALWSYGPRLIAVRGGEVVVFSTNIARTRARREVWRGRTDELEVRPYLRSYVLRIRADRPKLRLQVDGTYAVDRLTRALDRLP